LDPRTEQHIGLPDLIGVLRFELLARGGGFGQQLMGGETVLPQKAIQRGGGQCSFLLPLGGSELPQQRRPGAMRVLALQPFDQRGGLRIDDTRLAAILPWLRCESFQAMASVTQCLVQ